MFTRLANSWALAKSSWGVLRTDKQLIVFPILSGIAFVLVLASFFTPFLLSPAARAWLEGAERQQGVPWALVALGFAFYLAAYFVIIFFNAALVSCALIRFNGGTPTVGDGLRAAASRLPQIFLWAVVSATVGILLKAIENAHERAGAFISAILGTVWSIVTYFVIPVLVVEKVGPFAAISRSTSVLKKTWGEALVGSFGVGLFVFLLTLPGILLLFAAGALFAAGQGAALVTAVGVLGVVWILIASAIGSALQGIYVSALYHYAEFNTAPGGFEESAMRGAFTAKSV